MKKMESDKVIVKKSRNGLGIFAKKDFSPKDKLFEVEGIFITCDSDDDIDEKIRNNAYRFDDDYFLSPKGYIADFLNHSCFPNSRVVKNKNKLFIVALKKIHKGEEITMDYSGIIALDDIWEMKCNCGEENCRGIISGYNSLPKKIRDRYIKDKIIPSYILKIDK